MTFGMFLHRIPQPRPLVPSFYKDIPTTDPSYLGTIRLHFYTPRYYFKRTQAQRYPLVVNFHGGGFVLGKGTDDARWVSALVHRVDVLCVSVDYRLAPEHPFPKAVEDGTDAVLYLVKNADKFGIDVNKIATTGFSAGGNMAFTVPLRLRQRLEQGAAPSLDRVPSLSEESEMLMNDTSAPAVHSSSNLLKETETVAPDFQVLAAVAWYPRVTMTIPRNELRKMNVRPDKHLPPFLCNLFDEAYLHPPDLDLTDPLLSPANASGDTLRELPDNIIIYSCEYDMLCTEADAFTSRLKALGKNVKYRMIHAVPHAWDKSPNPFRAHWEAAKTYSEVCVELGRIFDSGPPRRKTL